MHDVKIADTTTAQTQSLKHIAAKILLIDYWYISKRLNKYQQNFGVRIATDSQNNLIDFFLFIYVE